MTYVLAAEGLLALVLLAYLVKSSRTIGSKMTSYNSNQMKKLKEIDSLIHNQEQSIKRTEQLLHLPMLLDKKVSWDFVVSLTSHQPRFASLSAVLHGLRNQSLAPNDILLNIATGDFSQLPADVMQLEKDGFITIVQCEDLGPAKKLIPTLGTVKGLPIIVIDDDLEFDSDLFLQLMIAHHLNPQAVIASRVHRVTVKADGVIDSFANWDKQYVENKGFAKDLLPTSGSGTLFPSGSLHRDAQDSNAYLKLAQNTDDLWWYFQARRAGTLVHRIEGFSALNFVEDSQEAGLWKNGNQEKNEVNLALLVKEYGNPLQL